MCLSIIASVWRFRTELAIISVIFRFFFLFFCRVVVFFMLVPVLDSIVFVSDGAFQGSCLICCVEDALSIGGMLRFRMLGDVIVGDAISIVVAVEWQS